MYLEEIILSLHKFWKERGCLIGISWDGEVGAGTFHPFTFFYSLDREPHRVGYVQWSRRPTDGRFAQNPLRMQKYFQYQVIIKPPPRDIKDLYIESLRALGVDLKRHDLRFVYDDWDSPTLGAQGLGWEVWLDSLEITQFTYFQQMASLEVFPVVCEITYGLERIAMFLQKKSDVFNIQYKKGISYRELFSQYEEEFSHFNFYYASVDRLLKEFEENERITDFLLKKDLVFPAYEYVLKNSHNFNLLDARGFVSQQQRPDFISRVRQMAKKTALKYLEKKYPQDA